MELRADPDPGVVMDGVGAAIVAGLASGTVIAAVIGLVTRGRELRLENRISDQFAQLAEVRGSQWALLQEVLGPVCAHLRRTKMAFGRWTQKNLYLEQRIIAESNEFIRDLLLGRYHLLTPELRPHADALVEHYDRWLEEFERQRKEQNPETPQSSFVFVGPEGYPFPIAAERAFHEALDATYAQLAQAPSLGGD